MLYYPISKKKSFSIHSSLFNIYNQLHSSSNWQKWDADLKFKKILIDRQVKGKGFTIVTNSETINVIFYDAFTFNVSKANFNYYITLVPQKYDNNTKVIITYRSTLFSELFLNYSNSLVKKASINSLSTFIENPLFYNNINFKSTTIDGIDMMICSSTVYIKNQFAEMKDLVDSIYNQVPLNALKNPSKVYIQFLPFGNQIKILVGVAVKKPYISSTNLTYMHIPAQNALMVNYTGQYSQKTNTYAIVENYLHEHALKSATPPIEIYEKNAIPLNDTSKITAQILFSAY